MHGRTELSLLLLALTACDEEGRRPPDAFTLRDSSGIEIPESVAPAWGPDDAWRLSAEPQLEIGQTDGTPEYLLDGIVSAWRLSTGGIVLATIGSLQIRFYGRDGRHLRTVGGRGEGPGEFQALDWIRVLPGDSVLAFDPEAGRLTLYGPDGDLARSSPVGETFSPSQSLVDVLADGSLVVREVLYDAAEPGADGHRIPSAVFLHFSADGLLMDTISVQPGLETYHRRVTLGGTHSLVSMLPPLFARVQVVAVRGDRVVLGSNDGFRLDIYTPDGTITRSVRALVDPTPVTEDLLERLRRAKVDVSNNPEVRRMLEISYSDLPHASVVPFYERVLLDDGGNLWTQNFRVADEDPQRWTVFDVEGRMLGEMVFPSGFHPLHIGIDFVLGVWTDELGVERIEVYGLEKS